VSFDGTDGGRAALAVEFAAAVDDSTLTNALLPIVHFGVSWHDEDTDGAPRHAGGKRKASGPPGEEDVSPCDDCELWKNSESDSWRSPEETAVCALHSVLSMLEQRDVTQQAALRGVEMLVDDGELLHLLRDMAERCEDEVAQTAAAQLLHMVTGEEVEPQEMVYPLLLPPAPGNPQQLGTFASPEKVELLVAMGFERGAVALELAKSYGNVERAANALAMQSAGA
jgi:hypothetical protein